MKRRMEIRIDEELYRKIVVAAATIYGDHHGALSAFAVDAFKHYLHELEQGLKTSFKPDIKPLNPRNKVHEAYMTMMVKVAVKMDGLLSRIVEYNTFLKWIMDTRGIKRRSAKEWFYRFYKEGFIKPITRGEITIESPSDLSKAALWELVSIPEGVRIQD